MDNSENDRIEIVHCQLSIVHFLHALAAEHGVKTIASPSISTGAYAFPVDRAARIALATVRDVLAAGCPVERVTFVCYTRADLAAYRKAFSNLISN